MPSAKFEADFTKWNRDLANAAEGLRGIEIVSKNVQSQLQKTANAYSGTSTIKQATLTAEAIKAVGGATTLTASEQKKANAVIQEAIDKYKALGQQAPAAIREVEAELAKLAKEQRANSQATEESGISFGKLAASYVTAQAALGIVTTGLRAVGQLVADSIQSYAAAEAAQSKLTTALRAQGQATPAVIDHYNDLAASIQATTAFSDDLTTSAEAMLVQIGDVLPGQMDKAIQASADLAAGLGIDLEQAATLVGKALEGNVGALGRYGVKIDEAAFKTQGADAVFAALEQRFGGQAAAQLETYAGKVALLANAWDNVKEAIGKFAVSSPIVDVGLRALAEHMNAAGEAGGKAALSWSDFLQTAQKIPGPANAIAQALTPIIGGLEKITGAIAAADGALRAFDKTQAEAGGTPFARLLAGTAAVPKPPGSGLSPEAEQEDARIQKSREELKKYTDQVKALRDQLTGAGLETELRTLQAAWKSLSTAQQQDAQTVARVLDVYNRLRPGLKSLPADFEHLRETNTQVLESTAAMNTQWAAYIAQAPAVENGTKRVAAALAGLNLNGTLVSHGLKDTEGRLVSLAVQMKAIPFAVKGREIAAANAETVDWAAHLDELAGSFAQLGQASGGSFAGIVKAIGTVIAAMSTARKASDQLKAGIKGIGASFTENDLGQTVIDWEHLGGAITQTATAAIAAVGAIAQATAAGSKAQRVTGGALAGAEAGAAFGPIGIGIGAGIGALVGFYRAGQAAEKAAADARVEIAKLGGAIQKTFGTMKLASQIATAFGVNLKEALARGGPEGAAMLQAAYDELTKKQDHLNELLDEYKIGLKDLGPAFQASKILENVNQLNQDWADLAGAGVPLDTIIGSMSDKINEFLAAALATGQKLPAQFQPILEQLIRMGKITEENARALLGLSDGTEVDFKAMQAVAEKYGISLAALGPKFQAAKIHDAAQTIIDDFQLLVGGGADVSGVLDGMADEISALVQQAIKSGVALPDTMKPWIEQLLKAGKLVDANGNKLTDLSGLKFEEPLSKSVDKLIDKLNDLIDKLGDVYGSIDGIPNDVTVTVHYRSDGSIEIPGDGGGGGDRGDQTHGGGGDQTHGGGGAGDRPPGYPPELPWPPTGSQQHHAMGGVIHAEVGRVLPFSPTMGTDRIPYTGTEGERILSIPQTQRIDRWLADLETGTARAPATPPAAGDNVTVNITINAIDTDGLKQTVERDIAPMLVELWRKNSRGTRTSTRQALGVAS